jgi:hypothetical protein
MLLALQEVGVLRLYESPEAAVRDVEALDAEPTFKAVFDDTGQTYAIEWTRPNRGRRVVQDGEYRLVPTGVYALQRLIQVIDENHPLDPEGSESQVGEIRRRLTAA